MAGGSKSSNSGERREHEIIPGGSSPSTSSEGAARAVTIAVDRLKRVLNEEIQGVEETQKVRTPSEAEANPRPTPSESGERGGADEIVPENSSRPAAAPVSSGGAVAEVAVEVDRWEALIARDIERAEEKQKARGSEEALPCICRVHPSIREQEREAYEPKSVSIGPLHCSKESLQPMEDIKLSYLNNLLHRSKENKLSKYIEVIRDCQAEARKQYAEAVEPDAYKFVRMLVVDGCFIIEYFVKRVFEETKQTTQLSGVRWGFSYLRRDLMLLENQIPFFVLVKLFNQSNIPQEGERQQPLTLMEIALKFLEVKLPEDRCLQVGQVLHLLHLYHLCLDPSGIPDETRSSSCGLVVLYPFKKAASLILALFFGLLYLVLIHKWPCRYSPTEDSEVPRMIPCATELHKAGVKFKKAAAKKGGVNCYLKVSFREGTLEIPFLKVEESTSSRLRNVIALEQCCSQVKSHFTSYAAFMDNIINTEGDVAILRRERIIESKLGSDEEVATMFNTLCKGAHLKYKEHYNARLFKDVNEFCRVPHHRWRASLKSKYFNNPWSIISLLAGIVLLFFAAVQAYFSAFPRK